MSGLGKSKRKKEIELEIPQAKNPFGVFQIGSSISGTPLV